MKEGIFLILIVGTLICLLVAFLGGSITLPKAEQWNSIIKIAFSALFIFILYRIGIWGYELKYPVQEAHAIVVEVQTETTRYGTAHGRVASTGLGKYRLQTELDIEKFIGHTAVFEFDTGERIELKVKAKDIPILKKEMRGTLTYRRGWMKGFEPS